jgi:hypothetical protein
VSGYEILDCCHLYANNQPFGTDPNASTFSIGKTPFKPIIGETLRIPIKIRNNSEKAQFYIIRKLPRVISTPVQKAYFCFDNKCLESDITVNSLSVVEPGETLQKLVYVVEGSLLTSQSAVRFQVFPSH